MAVWYILAQFAGGIVAVMIMSVSIKDDFANQLKLNKIPLGTPGITTLIDSEKGEVDISFISMIMNNLFAMSIFTIVYLFLILDRKINGDIVGVC